MPSRLLGNLPTNCFAVCEVAAPAPDVASFVDSIHPSLCVVQADISPAGFAWFQIVVADQPRDRQWSISSAALRALTAAAEQGHLPDFRIVYGAHLLELPRAMLGLELHQPDGTAGGDDRQAHSS